MNTQSFLENFGPIANAPGGVKRLREMIYYLGVTGALCRQYPNEGNGALLLAQVEEEKHNRISAGTFKRSPKLENLRDTFSESLPVIPKIWTWTRLVDIGEISPKNESEDDAMASFASMSAISDMHGIPVQPENRPWETIKKGFTHFANGDVVVAKITPCFENGKAAVIRDLPNEIGAGTTELHVVRPLPGIEPAFIYIFLRSPYFKTVGEGYMTGTAGQKRLPSEYFATRPFPLPPLEEQKRIVAKVDELMALCDKLEARQQERERRFPVLSRACHARFVESPTLANLKAIFDEVGAVSPEEMRNTVLNLAVKGNLVQQCPTDEPAEQWLLHFQKRNTDKSTYNRTALGTVIGETGTLPDGWITTQLDQVFIVSGGIQKTPRRTPRDNAFPYLGVANVYRNRLDLTNIKKFELEDGELERYRLDASDLLIIEGNGSIDQVGRCAQWNGQIENCVHQNHIIRCRPIDPEIGSFILLFLNSPIGMEIMKELAITSSGLYSLSVGKIRKIQLRIPPIKEQRRIVAKVDQLMALIDKLEEQQARKAKVAQAFAQAAVAAITGTEIKEPEKMKAPKTELVSRLQTRNKPNAADPAPLAKLLTEHNGELPAKALWQRSGLEIDAFYQQLRTEMANGWIIEPEKAVMKEIEAD